jgi:hypothetical protein
MDKLLCMIAMMRVEEPGVVFVVDPPSECEAAQRRAHALNKETEDDKGTVYVVVAGKPCKFTQTCKEDEQ